VTTGIVESERTRDNAVRIGSQRGMALLPADEWAWQQFAQVELGDQRRNQRALEVAAKMAAQPQTSLPAQMQSRSALRAAYRLLNHPEVTMDALLEPHRRQTLAQAAAVALVLFIEDTTELDFTAHPATKNLGPIGDGRGRGLLLHSTLAVTPDDQAILGLAHAQVVVRQAAPKSRPHRSASPEGQVWEVSAVQVGSPPPASTWVHVSDRGSDIFEYMLACLDRGKHFLLRAFHNRVLDWGQPETQSAGEQHGYLLDYARGLSAQPDSGYTVTIHARDKRPARQAQVVLAWSQVNIAPPVQAPLGLRERGSLPAWLLRVWEPAPPAEAEAVEWILVSSLPITTLDEARRAAGWYGRRWLVEDYHQCLKTGCQVEQVQLDDGEDVRRFLGFAIPIAVRLLQLREAARQTPCIPAKEAVDPLMVEVLTCRRPKMAAEPTLAEFWQAVASLGGHQGRKSDGPPGWRTIWRGWRYLSDLTEGARLFVKRTQR
jgi:hypothetical protein